MKATAVLLFVLGKWLASPAGAAPPERAVPVIEEGSPAIDGSGLFYPGVDWVWMVLFHGVTPPHGFQIQLQEASGCPLYIAYVGPHAGSPGSGFLIALNPGTSLGTAPSTTRHRWATNQSGRFMWELEEDVLREASRLPQGCGETAPRRGPCAARR